MHPNAERLRAEIRETHGVEVEVRELPEETRTAAEAAEAIDCPLAAIVKSVVMAVDGDPFLVLTSGRHRVDEAALASRFDADAVRSATPDEVKEWTGYAIGGVPPIGHGIDRVLFDRTLLHHEEIWGGGGVPEGVVALDPETLRTRTDADPADVFE